MSFRFGNLFFHGQLINSVNESRSKNKATLAMARSLSLNCLTGQIGGVAETVQACLSVDDPGCEEHCQCQTASDQIMFLLFQGLAQHTVERLNKDTISFAITLSIIDVGRYVI